MPAARDAKEWAASGGLHGIGNSLYTPFSGTDGDDIDYDAYRALVRYCVGDLGHAMLWLTSGIAEWWSLTIDERKQLLEVAVEEARAIAPDTVIQACTSAASAKDCLELTQHAEAPRRRHLLPADAADGGRTAARVCCASSSTSPTAPTSRSGCSTRHRPATCSRRKRSRGSRTRSPRCAR